MKKRMQLNFMAIAMISMIAVLLLTTVVFYNLFQNEVIENLHTCADMLGEDLVNYKDTNRIISQKKVDNIRVTLIDKDGVVLADSDVNADVLGNHKERPEVKEAIEKECKIEADISANIEKLEPMFNPEEQKKILVYMKDTPKKFHEMAVNAAAGKKLYQKLDKLTQNHNMDNAAYDKLLKQIKKNTKKIEKNQNYSLVEETLGRANSILKTSQYIEYGSFEEECKEIARRGILFMELVEECANLFEGFSDEVFGKIEE